MTDPLSIAASVTTLLQLTEAIIQGLNSVRHASKERASIRDELYYVSGLLFNLKRSLSKNELWETIINSLGGPAGPLEQLKEALQDLARKLPHNDGTKETMKRLTWRFEKDDVESLLKKIERQKTLILLAMENIHIDLSHGIHQETRNLRNGMQAIQDGFSQMQLDQKARLRQLKSEKIIAWMSQLNFFTVKTDLRSRTQNGTGKWLLNHPHFKKWADGAQSILFCSGQPGVGKTILTSIAIDYLQDTMAQDEAIAYTFCNYKEQGSQTTEHLLANLLQQLSYRRIFVSDEITQLYSFHVRRRTRPSPAEWLSVLKTEVQHYSKVYLFIDAIDELSESDGTRDEFLAELRTLQPAVHLMVTSRPLPSFHRGLDNEQHIEILGSDDDIRIYLEYRLKNEPRMLYQLQIDPPLQALIVGKILKTSKGVFLIAQLHVDSIVKKHNRRSIDFALQSLPTKLDKSYDEILERISEQNEDDCRLGMCILSWLSLAARPFTVIELQHALALGFDESMTNGPSSPSSSPVDITDLAEENLISEDVLATVCAGLVTIDRSSKIIRLVHSTVQEYLERIQHARFPVGRTNLAKTCISYLSLPEVAGSVCHDDKGMQQRMASYPFVSYAARYWGKHVCDDPDKSLQHLALTLLKDQTRVEAVAQIMHLPSCRFTGYSQHFPRTTTPLHISASFGLKNISKELIGHSASAKAQDENGWTPLHRASENGHHTLIELLLENGADVNSSAQNGGTALHRAAKNGHDTVVQALLSRNAEVDMEDQYGGTALHRAARAGCTEVASLLLESGAQSNKLYDPHVIHESLNKGQRSIFGLSPSYNTAWEVLSIALEYLATADIKLKRFYGGSALHEAAHHGHIDLVHLLLRFGASVDATDYFGGTPLHRAARKGHEQIAEALIKAGARVNATCDSEAVKYFVGDHFSSKHRLVSSMTGKTPLHKASMAGHLAVVRILLQNRAEVNCADENGMTPLALAAQAGHAEIVEHLIQQGSPVNGVDVRRWRRDDGPVMTPLGIAAKNGHFEVARILLASGADVDFVGKNCSSSSQGTPLFEACGAGHFVLAALLLEHGADPYHTSPWAMQMSPFKRASSLGHEDIVRLVLNGQHGSRLEAEPDVRTNVGVHRRLKRSECGTMSS